MTPFLWLTATSFPLLSSEMPVMADVSALSGSSAILAPVSRLYRSVPVRAGSSIASVLPSPLRAVVFSALMNWLSGEVTDSTVVRWLVAMSQRRMSSGVLLVLLRLEGELMAVRVVPSALITGGFTPVLYCGRVSTPTCWWVTVFQTKYFSVTELSLKLSVASSVPSGLKVA